jgi:hypothetical protein
MVTMPNSEGTSTVKQCSRKSIVKIEKVGQLKSEPKDYCHGKSSPVRGSVTPLPVPIYRGLLLLNLQLTRASKTAIPLRDNYLCHVYYIHQDGTTYCRPDQNFEHETKTNATEINRPPLRSNDSPVVNNEAQNIANDSL